MQYRNVKEKYKKNGKFSDQNDVEENDLNYTNITHQVWIRNK